MILLASVDARMRAASHNRVRPILYQIKTVTENGKLWIRPASEDLFPKEEFPNIHVSENPLADAGFSDFVYAEDIPVNDKLDTINKVYLYRFANDTDGNILDANLSDWQLLSSETIEGNEPVEEEIYVLW